jgi:hypothetical protein
MKPVAIGRQNWLFVGSVAAGDRAAVLMTLVASCKENGVEPWAYLRALFGPLPRDPDLSVLLPDRWLADNPKHRWKIAAQRKAEREKKATPRMREAVPPSRNSNPPPSGVNSAPKPRHRNWAGNRGHRGVLCIEFMLSATDTCPPPTRQRW